MAEGTTVEWEKVGCRFFLASYCRDGDRCLFSHDVRRYVPDNVCRYYLKGTCVFGERCMYDHVFVHNSRNARENPRSERCSAGPSSSSANGEASACLRPPILFAERAGGHDQQRRFGTRTFKRNTKSNKYDVCELCATACLDPNDEKQRKAHIEECEKEQLDMFISFAIQKSADKTCGICMDVVLEKEPSQRQFGILEKCNHVYCLSCIRKWRKPPSSGTLINAPDSTVTQACPECRIVSDFVVPSLYFVDNVEEKKKLIADYNASIGKKPCWNYIKSGICPFGESCLYLHEEPGTSAELTQPSYRGQIFCLMGLLITVSDSEESDSESYYHYQ